MNQFDTIKAVMKNFLLVILLIPLAVFAEGPDDLVDNGLFFRDKQYYEYYLKENAKHLGDALKSFTTASKAWDSCPARAGQYGMSDQYLIQKNLKDTWGNFSFLKLDTEKFYTDDDASKFKCSMDVSLILANYPKEIRAKHISSGIEDGNMEYWGKLGIAARWKIAADAFKKCGIKISSLELTMMEKNDGSPPDISIGSPSEKLVTNAFYERDVFRGKNSIKTIYLRGYSDGTRPVSRGESNFNFATTPYSNPNNQIILLKRESIYAPIVQKNSSSEDGKYVVELHEIYHALTNESDEEAHVSSNSSVPRNVLKTRITQSNGSFTNGPGGQCETMIKKGSARGLLRCN